VLQPVLLPSVLLQVLPLVPVLLLLPQVLRLWMCPLLRLLHKHYHLL
jgi:hypothetical protein